MTLQWAAGNLYIVKDISAWVQHGAADEILADGHRAEVVDAYQALVEHQPIYSLFGRVSPLECAGPRARQEARNKFFEFSVHGFASFVASWCSLPPSRYNTGPRPVCEASGLGPGIVRL